MSQSAEAQSVGTGISTRTMRIVSGLAVLLGAWLVLAPMAFESTDTALWNNIIVGVAIIILGAFNYYRMMSDRLPNVGVSSLVALLGLWALIVPFIFEMGSDELGWATAIPGIIIAILGGYNAYANRKATTTAAEARA